MGLIPVPQKEQRQEKKKGKMLHVLVAHTCNPRYSGEKKKEFILLCVQPW
jgi:hypothetical protein